MLTRMSYIWQNNEGHKYFKAASMAGGSQGNTKQFHIDLMLQPSDMGFLHLIGTKCLPIKASVYISDNKAILGSF